MKKDNKTILEDKSRILCMLIVEALKALDINFVDIETEITVIDRKGNKFSINFIDSDRKKQEELLEKEMTSYEVH